MPEMEEVPGLELGDSDAVCGMQMAGVEEAVGGVENPDGQEHGYGRDDWKSRVRRSCNKDGPKNGDRGRVQREQMPQGEGTGGAGRGRDLGGGCHSFDFKGFRRRFECRDADFPVRMTAGD